MSNFAKCFLLALLLVAVTTVEAKGPHNSSNDKLVIRISVSASMSGYFNIYIRKQEGKVKIVYSLLDSVRRALDKDSSYMVILNKLKKGEGIRDTAVVRKLNDIREQYSVYSRDSITINLKSDTSYANLLNQVAISSAEGLENKTYNKTRIVIDGSNIDYMISDASGTKVVSTISPNKISNPLLYQLLSETFNLYRQSHSNNFLPTSKTSGY